MMKRRSFLLAAFLGLAVAAPVVVPSATPEAHAKPSAGPSASQIADRVQAFYNKTKTFKAGFKQRYYIKNHHKFKDSKGQVIFAKPGKMSWRYTSNGNRVVSDGKIIKVYEQDNKQMYESSVNKSQYPAALSFLVGGGNLKKTFKLRKIDSKKVNFEGGYVIEARPKKPTPAYKTMLLYVDAKTSQVRRVLILDAQGNRNRFTFVQPSINVKPPADEFKFSPPPGTQVIRP